MRRNICSPIRQGEHDNTQLKAKIRQYNPLNYIIVPADLWYNMYT